MQSIAFPSKALVKAIVSPFKKAMEYHSILSSSFYMKKRFCSSAAQSPNSLLSSQQQ